MLSITLKLEGLMVNREKVLDISTFSISTIILLIELFFFKLKIGLLGWTNKNKDIISAINPPT